jgi:hypothetical protein
MFDVAIELDAIAHFICITKALHNFLAIFKKVYILCMRRSVLFITTSIVCV